MPPKGRPKGSLTARNGRPATKISRVDAKYGDPTKILDDKKSPLYKDDAKIKEYLSHDIAKEKVGDIFDGISGNCSNNAIATFKGDGKEDRHDEEWLRQALAASARRQSGDFDAYLNAKFDSEWAEEGGEEYDEGEDEDEDTIQQQQVDAENSNLLGAEKHDNDLPGLEMEERSDKPTILERRTDGNGEQQLEVGGRDDQTPDFDMGGQPHHDQNTGQDIDDKVEGRLSTEMNRGPHVNVDEEDRPVTEQVEDQSTESQDEKSPPSNKNEYQPAGSETDHPTTAIMEEVADTKMGGM